LAVLIYFLYAALFILAIIALLCLLLLLVPLRYKIEGGYDHFFRVDFSISCTPCLAVRGQWTSKAGNPLQMRFFIAGLSFALNPQKWGSKRAKKKKEDKRFSPFSLLFSLDREFMGNVMELLRDILNMLKPKNVVLKGRLGFPEPHLNAWLAGWVYTLKESCRNVMLDIEPVWEEEHYEFSCTIEGRIAVSLLFRVLRFLLRHKTRDFLRTLKREKASYAA